MNIVERSSGFWIVDASGVVEGPFDSAEEAAAVIHRMEQQPGDDSDDGAMDEDEPYATRGDNE